MLISNNINNVKMTSKRKNKDAWAPTGFEEWGGYMAAKKAKLEEQFQERAREEQKDTSNLFQGVCIFVNGYTNPSSDDLRVLMMKHNGVYHHYLRSKFTTHVIASNLPYSKIMMHKKSQNPLPICKPEWITDSIKAGKLLNFRDYLLYSQHTRTQPRLAFAARETTTSTESGAATESLVENKAPPEPEISHEGSEAPQSSETSKLPSKTSPTKEGSSKTSNSTKNPEFLSEFYNNSRLHHISTMGAVFKDYINELRDKSDKTFPGLEKLKELKKLKKSSSSLDLFDSASDSEEEILDSPAPVSSSEKQEPVVMHIDMDCFFVSVGLRNRPELKGLPVAVTHAKGNKAPQNGNSREIEMKMYKERRMEKLNKLNHKVEEQKEKEKEKPKTSADKYENLSLAEIASCSYEARKAGIKNGMFLGQALKLCPDLKMIPYDFEGYKEVSYALYDTVATYTLDIEAVSCDEMYADCTKIMKESGLTPLEFAQIIRKEISEKTGCPVSTGFGQNKLQARLATRRAKPNGQFHLESKDVQRYMSTINIRDLPGVGYTMTQKLNAIGVHTCIELQSVSLGELQKELGKKTGEMVHNMCRGIDNSKLNLERVRKSVSAEVNYGIRFEDSSDANKFLKQLSEEVCSRLNKACVKGRTLTLKLMIRSKNAPLETAKFMGHGLCDHLTRSKNLISPVNDVTIVTKEVLSLWNQLQQKPEDVRGIGIQMSRLESTKKTGNSTLMSFINKAKPSDADNKPKTSTSDGTVAKIQKPRGLDGFLISKEFPAVTIVKKTPASLDDSEFTPSSNQSSGSSGAESLKRTTGTSNPSKCNGKVAASDRIEVDVQKSPSTSKGERRSGEHPIIQDIDEAVLAELPEEIRNEIIIAAKESVAPNVIEKPENPPPSLVQKKQESYFKESKKNVERPKKSEMPTLQEIDLAVLLELPDDIRNEILNEYRTKANEAKQPPTPQKNEPRKAPPIDEANLSISQVDPEVLAALPKEIQNDVKDYCKSKKLENKSKAEQNNKNGLISKQFGAAATSKTTTNQKTVKQTKSKVVSAKICKLGKIAKTNNKTSKQSPEKKQRIVQNYHSPPESNIDENQEIEMRMQENTVEDIKSLSMAAKSGDPDDQKAVLKHLVDELMSLPLKEVKFQIQNWIFESDSVNEVDFLAFTTFLSSLPRIKRIEDLHVLLKTMHRCIEKTKRCVWHRAYRKTVEYVQRHMLAVYDSSLMVPMVQCERFDCKNKNET